MVPGPATASWKQFASKGSSGTPPNGDIIQGYMGPSPHLLYLGLSVGSDGAFTLRYKSDLTDAAATQQAETIIRACTPSLLAVLGQRVTDFKEQVIDASALDVADLAKDAGATIKTGVQIGLPLGLLGVGLVIGAFILYRITR